MRSDSKPIIKPPTKTLFTVDPFVPKSEPPDLSPTDSLTSSIPQLFSFLKSTFKDEDYVFVQGILMSRENSLNLELQKLRRNVELLEKNQALCDLKILHKEEQLKDCLNKCENLRENGARLKKDKRVLSENVARLEKEKRGLSENVARLEKEKRGLSENVARLEKEKRVLSEIVARLEEDKRVLSEKNLRTEETYKKINDDLVEKQKEETKLLFEKLKDCLNKCENFREYVDRLKEDKRVLCEKNLRIEETYKKINDDLVEKQKEETKFLFERIEELKREKSVVEENFRAYEKKFIELNDRVSLLEEELDSGADMGSEVNLKENNLESSQGRDGAKSVCHSTGNSSGKEPLPTNLAWDSGNPTRNSLACEAGDCIKNNLKAVSDKPGSSPVILIIEDDAAYASKSSGLGRDLTCPQMKGVHAKGSSTLMPKRKRSMNENANNDSPSNGRQKTVPIEELVNDGKRTFVGDNSSNPEHSSKITRVTPCPEKSSEFIRPCEDKLGSKCPSQLLPRRLDKPNRVRNGSDLDSDNDSSNTKHLDFASINESKKWLSEAHLSAAFGIDPDLCVYAVCALYRQQISKNDSSKASSYSGSENDEKSITIMGKYLTDRDHKLKRKAPDVEPFYERCKELALRYCHQLFQLYHSKEDHLFCPGTVFTKL